MTMRHGDEEVEEGSNNGLVDIQSISPDAALKMVNAAIDKARELHLAKGMVGVCGREGFMLASASCGGVTRANGIVVSAKLDTVMNTTRSTHLQMLHMEKEVVDWQDYAGAVRTKFGGGLKVYADTDKTIWVGAIAYSGGDEYQDRAVCAAAAAAMDFFVDEDE